ncbi:AAA family ATPase [uncultured Rhodoblastus sp.]|uniref:AAA family ATPase n=1 Tax=uncultured Rhodoblastus sp. TaxID=543037 RepID=UPI0025EA1317|nr:AAA family ATPase [uncultured Rhodoblastus sp.]
MTGRLDLKTTYRTILKAARERRFISYGDLAKANGADWQKVRYDMNRHLGDLVQIAVQNGWPMTSAIVVNRQNLETGTLDGSALQGFLAAARDSGLQVDDPDAFVRQQQLALFDWAPTAPDDPDFQSALADEGKALVGPKFVQYFAPVLDALRSLGGASEPKEVIAKVRELADVAKEELADTNKNGQSKFENNVAWARFYLVKAGLIDRKQRGRWVLTPDGRETHLDHGSALALFKDVQSRFRDASSDEDEEAPAPEEELAADLFDDPNRQFWFVGAIWNGADDQTDRFLSEGIWQNGYDEKFSDHVKRMKPGDRIAIKASFVKKYGLPFNNQEKPVSCMRIKAIGTITAATKDGKTVKVNWTAFAERKDWYFYTYRVTIVEADATDDLARRLIQFAFGDHKQDYEFWLRVPYFAKKYRPRSTTVTEIEREEEEEKAELEDSVFESYGIEDIISDGCFLPNAELRGALSRLNAKLNLILQGPPGTGKTWLAKRLAYALIGTKDPTVARKRTRAIQFHPSLSYEDFVRGWRPDGNGQLSLIDGAFLEAVEAARAERDRPFVVIIEEINRGNPAQIFGEMLTLLEKDKRNKEEAIELAYPQEQGERIHIPPNLYVIGTMNIADRSLALVDFALRRRFAFVSLQTQLNDRWKAWCVENAGMDAATVDTIKRLMSELNGEIENDRSLGAQFKIGHSFVTPGPGETIADTAAWFRQVVETEIGPLLEEYWFDNPDKARTSTQRLLAGL